MRINETIKRDIEESIGTKGTSDLLKRIVFTIVEKSLIKVYGINYSTKCLQSSIGIQMLLKDFGINSRILCGSVCFSSVRGYNPYQVTWEGFWDKNYHIWIITDFFEIVDLTISQLNVHPATTSKYTHSIPPLWWSPADLFPPIFKYLPDGQANVGLIGEDLNLFEQFKNYVKEFKHKVINGLNINDLNFEVILTGPSALDNLLENGNHWALGSLLISQRAIEFPEWIKNKEKELLYKDKPKI